MSKITLKQVYTALISQKLIPTSDQLKFIHNKMLETGISLDSVVEKLKGISSGKIDDKTIKGIFETSSYIHWDWGLLGNSLEEENGNKTDPKKDKSEKENEKPNFNIKKHYNPYNFSTNYMNFITSRIKADFVGIFSGGSLLTESETLSLSIEPDSNTPVLMNGIVLGVHGTRSLNGIKVAQFVLPPPLNEISENKSGENNSLWLKYEYLKDGQSKITHINENTGNLTKNSEEYVNFIELNGKKVFILSKNIEKKYKIEIDEKTEKLNGSVDYKKFYKTVLSQLVTYGKKGSEKREDFDILIINQEEIISSVLRIDQVTICNVQRGDTLLFEDDSVTIQRC